MNQEIFRYMNFNEIEDYQKRVGEMDISLLNVEEVKD